MPLCVGLSHKKNTDKNIFRFVVPNVTKCSKFQEVYMLLHVTVYIYIFYYFFLEGGCWGVDTNTIRLWYLHIMSYYFIQYESGAEGHLYVKCI